MFKTVIVESDIKQLNILKKILINSSPQINIVGEVTELSKASDVILNTSPDLVIINLVSQQKKYFDLLEALMPIDFEIIFISNNEKSSLKAIKYNPIDYLISPIKQNELQNAIKKAIQKITDKYVSQQLELLLSNIKSAKNINLHKIAVPTLEGFIFIELDHIIRCEANGSYTIIYTTNKQKILASKSIKEYEEILPSYQFFRIHNSHLVNINRMMKYNKGRGGSVTMEDGTQIEVASRRRSDFLKMFQ
jgi:two-component system LytT family response regulator